MKAVAVFPRLGMHALIDVERSNAANLGANEVLVRVLSVGVDGTR